MKKLVFILAIGLIAFCQNDLYSQNLKRFVTNRAGTAAEATGERLADESDTVVVKGVNKGIDQLKGRFFGTSGSSSSSEQESSGTESEPDDTYTDEGSTSGGSGYNPGNSSSGSLLGKALMGSMGFGAPVNTKGTYEFNAYVQMDVSTYNQNGDLEESGKYDTYNNSESMDYALVIYDNNDRSTIIFDMENGLMLTLSESGGEKMGFAIAFDSDSLAQDIESYDEEDIQDNTYLQYKTGKTKNILGYKCEEYLIDDPEDEVHIWVTEDVNKKLQKEVMKNSVFGGMFLYAGYMNGMVLEYDIYDKESKEKIIMQVTDLSFDKKHTVSTNGYNIMSMGGIPEEE